MTAAMAPSSTTLRPLPTPAEAVWRRLFAGWLAVLAFTLAWDASRLDVTLMRRIGSPEGFTLQHHWWLEVVLHDRVRQIASAGLVLTWIWALLPQRWSAAPAADRRLAVFLGTAGLVAINLIKNQSATSCPWEWQMFGGTADVVSHWAWGLKDGGTGRCFPGGHASSGMGFLALALPWLAPRTGTAAAALRSHRRQGWWCLWLALAVGLLCGAVQTLRGAHPPSHTLWTLLICGGLALLGWWPWLFTRRSGRNSPAQTEAQRQVYGHAHQDGPQHTTAPEEPGRAGNG